MAGRNMPDESCVLLHQESQSLLGTLGELCQYLLVVQGVRVHGNVFPLFFACADAVAVIIKNHITGVTGASTR